MVSRAVREIADQMDWKTAAAAGLIPGVNIIHKFGRNAAIGTTYVPVCSGGVYQTPQVGGALPLRIAAGGNAADDAAGSGARTVVIEGLDQDGDFVTETLTLAGASASDPTSISFLRLFRAYVATSGSYATQSQGSHVGDIVIEDTSSNTWATIDATDFPRGQSQIGVYSVPNGFEAYISTVELSVASTKVLDLNFYVRENILQTSAPYAPMRLKRELVGIEGNSKVEFDYPIGPYPALSDFGFMAKVSSSTADVSIDFTIIQVAV